MGFRVQGLGFKGEEVEVEAPYCITCSWSMGFKFSGYGLKDLV